MGEDGGASVSAADPAQAPANSGSNPAIGAATDKSYVEDKSLSWNSSYVSKPGSSCSSEYSRCETVCGGRDRFYRKACDYDCAARLKYCKVNGFYPWINGKSIQVSTKD